MAIQIWATIHSGKGSLPEGTNPWLEPLFWLITNDARGHPAEASFREIVLDIAHYKVFENCIFENEVIFPKGQWVNKTRLIDLSSSTLYALQCSEDT